jgi:hypothetical protein
MGNEKRHSAHDFLERLQQEFAREREITHETKLAEIRARSYALIWTGPKEELVEAVTTFYNAGWIQAVDLTDALRKAAFHFVGPDGKSVIEIPLILEPGTTPRFRPLDENYQTVEFDGKQYSLTPTQSTVLRVLHKALIDKRASVGLKELQKALGTNTGKMSHWFRGRNKPLYGKLIIKTASRDHYRLDL